MSLSFGEIFLYSQDPAKLYHFLSFLLDVEADAYEDERVSFHFSGINFVILLDEDAETSETRAFSLKVNSFNELKDLAKNIEFYYYKEGTTSAKPRFKGDLIHFEDPDGRSWCVEIAKNNTVLTHTGEKFSTNVRMC
jgi:hypothetical protein